jgi:hypothetical protein
VYATLCTWRTANRQLLNNVAARAAHLPPHGHQPLHQSLSFQSPVHEPNWWVNFPKLASMYSRTPTILINSDGQPSGYAEDPYNWIFI